MGPAYCYDARMSGQPVTKTMTDFSCGGVVWDAARRRLLLVKVVNLANETVWTFPKGHPEKGESDEQAAVREVLEETGWRARVVRPIKDAHYSFVREDVRYEKTVRWFLMVPDAKDGEFDPEEVVEPAWVDVAAVQGLLGYDSDRDLLAAALPYFL